ncbi:hypothetical protein [Lentibacillus sp. CBA3610]|uniref:hypothetical protein n=1 Tax=Lentibacillus sp. CBA3610 TaxID=2518176 RepID=UPI0015955429|nr:hypothetical protein [Lentibacillus sp. CBA3610]QKY70671.1 hypothetical protein Len3610_14685 [Lentibacillus sp. CBA3610]
MGWGIRICSEEMQTWAGELEYVPKRVKHGLENQNMFRRGPNMGWRIKICSEESQTWAGKSEHVPERADMGTRAGTSA